MVAVFLADPVARVRLKEISLCARYGLTPTEARIVADLAFGHSVETIADLHRISRYTIHHHLKSIFRKTDTTRQPELVALVLSSSMAEAAPPAATAG
ncbi:MAG: helix-turn-helix transcriptional regulator [Ferrovibrionaceae bacterium]